MTLRLTQVQCILNCLQLLAKLSGSEGPSLVRAQPFYVNTSQDSLHQMWAQCETLQAKGKHLHIKPLAQFTGKHKSKYHHILQ